MPSISDLLKKQENLRRSVVPLQPSENVMTRNATMALSSDFNHRYSLSMDSEYRGSKMDNAYAGTRFSEELIEKTEKLAALSFKMDFADVRPISGHLAAMQVLGNLLKKGDSFLYIPQEWGGYDGYESIYLPRMFGLKGRKFPMKNWKIDYEKLGGIKTDYAALVLGASVFFHPYDLKKLRKFFPDSLILYDASHVLGLLSQGLFQKDLDLVDILYGSTHKNFPGPQGGIIIGKGEFENKIKEQVIWKYYDNFHLARIAALGISFEFLERSNYGLRCIKNTEALIKTLREFQVHFVNEPEVTESCMFMLDHENPAELSRKLERHHILIDRIGRVGLNEATMRGLRPQEMKVIGGVIKKVIYGEKFHSAAILRPVLDKMNDL